jgi:hypothetical protein
LLPDGLAAGEVVGEVENVSPGERAPVRDLAELGRFARAAAERQRDASASTSA